MRLISALRSPVCPAPVCSTTWDCQSLSATGVSPSRMQAGFLWPSPSWCCTGAEVLCWTHVSYRTHNQAGLGRVQPVLWLPNHIPRLWGMCLVWIGFCMDKHLHHLLIFQLSTPPISLMIHLWNPSNALSYSSDLSILLLKKVNRETAAPPWICIVKEWKVLEYAHSHPSNPM